MAVSVLLILVLALPVLYPPTWGPDFGGVEPLDIIAWEQQGSFAIGTTSTGDFEPVGAAMVPMQPAPSLLASYDEAGPVDRVNRAMGDAQRFLTVWQEYKNAEEVTRRRLYLETLEEVLPKAGRKFIVDPGQGGILPLLRLGEEGGAR